MELRSTWVSAALVHWAAAVGQGALSLHKHLYDEQLFVYGVSACGRSTRTAGPQSFPSGGPFTETMARLHTSLGEIMHASNHPSFRQPAIADRRRRHLVIYHRALRAADTPEQRAAVAARYRQLFAVTAAS